MSSKLRWRNSQWQRHLRAIKLRIIQDETKGQQHLAWLQVRRYKLVKGVKVIGMKVIIGVKVIPKIMLVIGVKSQLSSLVGGWTSPGWMVLKGYAGQQMVNSLSGLRLVVPSLLKSNASQLTNSNYRGKYKQMTIKAPTSGCCTCSLHSWWRLVVLWPDPHQLSPAPSHRSAETNRWRRAGNG